MLHQQMIGMHFRRESASNSVNDSLFCRWAPRPHSKLLSLHDYAIPPLEFEFLMCIVIAKVLTNLLVKSVLVPPQANICEWAVTTVGRAKVDCSER
jgi:hypothetical protein